MGRSLPPGASLGPQVQVAPAARRQMARRSALRADTGAAADGTAGCHRWSPMSVTARSLIGHRWSLTAGQRPTPEQLLPAVADPASCASSPPAAARPTPAAAPAAGPAARQTAAAAAVGAVAPPAAGREPATARPAPPRSAAAASCRGTDSQRRHQQTNTRSERTMNIDWDGQTTAAYLIPVSCFRRPINRAY